MICPHMVGAIFMRPQEGIGEFTEFLLKIYNEISYSCNMYVLYRSVGDNRRHLQRFCFETMCDTRINDWSAYVADSFAK